MPYQQCGRKPCPAQKSWGGKRATTDKPLLSMNVEEDFSLNIYEGGNLSCKDQIIWIDSGYLESLRYGLLVCTQMCEYMAIPPIN